MEFLFFTLTLIGIAIFHNRTLPIALGGLFSILLFKLIFRNLNLLTHLQHESVLILNIFGLLIGFAVLADYFEKSKVPDLLPDILPDDWKGGFYLLVMVFIASAFLDNIAAAMLGGAIAKKIFNNKVHIGFIAAIVAASNAGGSGSVLGDTTTTMLWISGISAITVLPAYIAAIPAFLFLAIIASKKQDVYNRITKDAPKKLKIEYKYLLFSLLILISAVITNIVYDLPSLGVWVAIIISRFIITLNLNIVREAIPGSIFLSSLILSASLMPVESLPSPSTLSTFNLGVISSVFDNIPLTKLAIEQGAYNWAMLAYAVGFGGSMIWFGSSAGVAICNEFPEGRSVKNWIKNAWFIPVAYVIGFICLMMLQA